MRAEGQLLEANDPASAVAALSAGTAEIEKTQEMDVQPGMTESGAAASLSSDGENGMVHTGMEKMTESDQTPSVSPVLLLHGQWRCVGDGTEGERVPLLEGDGTQLVNKEGQAVYETPGWHLLHDQHGYMLCDQNGDLCFEEMDEDHLAMVTWSVA